MRENWVDWLFVCFEICHECKMDVDMDVDYGMNVGEKWDCIYLYFVCILFVIYDFTMLRSSSSIILTHFFRRLKILL